MAVVLPESRVADVLARIDSRTLQPVDDIPGLESGESVLLVPDPDARFHAGLARGLGGEGAVVGPIRPWLQAAGSYQRALRAWRLGLAGSRRWAPASGTASPPVPGRRVAVGSSTPRRSCPSCSSPRIPRAGRPAGPGAGPAGRPAPGGRGPAHRDAARLAAAPRPARRRRRRAVRPPADRALPDGPGPRAVRRLPRRPEGDPRADPGAHPPARLPRDRPTPRTLTAPAPPAPRELRCVSVTGRRLRCTCDAETSQVQHRCLGPVRGVRHAARARVGASAPWPAETL